MGSSLSSRTHCFSCVLRAGLSWRMWAVFINLAPERVRNLVRWGEKFESEVPERSGKGKWGHMLEKCTLLATQGTCSWKKAVWALQHTGKVEATLRGEVKALGFIMASQNPRVLQKDLPGVTLGDKSKAQPPPSPSNKVASALFFKYLFLFALFIWLH